MKARVIATGKIVEISTFQDNNKFPTTYDENELEFFVPNDYWTRLEHQAAIAAMQGILASPFDIPNLGSGDHYQDAAIHAAKYAHALVEKYKKEEK